MKDRNSCRPWKVVGDWEGYQDDNASKNYVAHVDELRLAATGIRSVSLSSLCLRSISELDTLVKR